MNGSSPDPYAASPKLAALSPDELTELMERYDAGEKATALINEFGLRIAVSELVMCFPPLVRPDHICPNCNIPMVSRHPSKSQLRLRNLNLPIFCPRCQHQDSDDCQCEHCQDRRKNQCRQEEARKRRLIRETYPLIRDNPRELSSLTLRERVLLGALLRNGMAEDYSRIHPLCDQKDKLSPRPSYDVQIINSLCAKQLLTIHPESPIAAFCDDTEHPFPQYFYPGYASYRVNIDAPCGYKGCLEYLMQPPEQFFYSCKPAEFHELWKEIAFEECMEYLVYRLNSVNFPFSPGEKTKAVFHDLLDHFSTAQIFCFIGRAIDKASTRALEQKLSKKHAANIVINTCQRQGEFALANHWDIYPYRRDFKCPQSTLSSFFYDRVLQLGSRGFELCPHKCLEVEDQ